MSDTKYRICNCCVMDTSDDNIVFDENGICERCNEYYNRILPEWNHGLGHEEELRLLLSDIKEKGKGKPYDCILGLSGGLDSSYMLHLAVTEWGLRPFVLHIDAGWDLPIAKQNINKLTEKLGIELHTETLDQNEMREMQLAWFKTGLGALDAPQDHAFIAVIDKYAIKLKTKYILNGYNIATEVISNPRSWFKGAGHAGDSAYLKEVIRKYCSIPIKKYPFTNGFKHKFRMPYILGIQTVKPLNFVPITKTEMEETLVREYEFEPYGQKHFEDMLTKFLDGWWLPTKFDHDIRRAQLSSLVLTGQMTREEALSVLKKPPMSEEDAKELFVGIAGKLGITEKELRDLYELPECTETFNGHSGIFAAGIKLYGALGLDKRIRK